MPTIASMFHRFVGKRAMMSVLEAPEMIRGGKVVAPANVGIQVPVAVVDARITYGKQQCLIRPLRGVGSSWVSSNRLRIVDEWPEEEDLFDSGRYKDSEDAPAETETPALDEQG